MSSPRSLTFGPALTLSMLLFAGGTIFGVAVHARWSPDAESETREPSSSPISRDEWESLSASVARLEAASRVGELVPPDARNEVGPSPVSREALAELTKEVRGLQASLERLRGLAERSTGEANAASTPRAILDAVPAIDWQAVDALREWHLRDEDAALRSIRLSTPAEIVRRFGEPTEVYRYREGVAFAYLREVEVGEELPDLRGVRIAFIDGFVQALWSE
ncbi:MAG: hypothetical protein IT453_15980 [Planctomycetes bacterium]|nr:hypothetical protein [Planctomycetota bacterium]